MPGPRRLRSGSHPDTSAQLLARRSAAGATPYHLTTPRAPSPKPPAQKAKPKPKQPTKRRQSPTGAAIIRKRGGTKRDVRAWRSLSQSRRTKIRRRVGRDGGKLLRTVRRIQRRRS